MPSEKIPVIEMDSKSAIVHVLCVTIALIEVAFCVAALADGRSVIVLKDEPPTVVDTAVLPDTSDFIEYNDADGITVTTGTRGEDYQTLAQLLGPRYGIGLLKDSSGRGWWETGDVPGLSAGMTLMELINELGAGPVVRALPLVVKGDILKHPIQFLSCTELRDTGMAAMSLGIIAVIAAGLMVIFHAAALSGLVKPKVAKVVPLLVWVVLSVGFLIVVVLAAVIYTKEWTCHNPVIPKLKPEDHFDLTYGLPFACVGFVASVVAVVAVALGVSSEGDLVSGGRVSLKVTNPATGEAV